MCRNASVQHLPDIRGKGRGAWDRASTRVQLTGNLEHPVAQGQAVPLGFRPASTSSWHVAHD